MRARRYYPLLATLLLLNASYAQADSSSSQATRQQEHRLHVVGATSSVVIKTSTMYEVTRPLIVQVEHSASILSAQTNDSRISLDLKPASREGRWLVSVTLPPNYTPFREPVFLTVTSDDADSLRLPIRPEPPPTLRTEPWERVADELVGHNLPSMLVRSRDGRTGVLPALIEGRQKVVILWSPACEHCQKLVPRINAFAARYPERASYYAISVLDRNAEKSQTSANSSLVPLSISEEEVLRHFGVTAFPLVLIVGKTNKVEAAHYRRVWEPNDLIPGLEDMLAKELHVASSKTTPQSGQGAPPPASTRPAGARISAQLSARAAQHKGALIKCKSIGRESLVIKEIAAPPSCDIKPPLPFTIPPGGVIVLRCTSGPPRSSSDTESALVIKSNDPESPVVRVPLWTDSDPLAERSSP